MIPPLVKTVVRAGSRERLTPANVRLDGPACIVTSPVCLVRWQPNGKVRYQTNLYLSTYACREFYFLKSLTGYYNGFIVTEDDVHI